MSYLTGCSSRRFIYSFGGSFIHFVAHTVKDSFVRMRSFVSTYIDDPATRSEVERRLQDLEQLAQGWRYEEFKDGFVNLVFQYVTWRRSPQP